MKLTGFYEQQGVIAFFGTVEAPRVCGQDWLPVSSPRGVAGRVERELIGGYGWPDGRPL